MNARSNPALPAPAICMIITLSHPCLYDSMEIFAFAFVTFTPSCFARATISMRLREETACAILYVVSLCSVNSAVGAGIVLSGVGLVVHEEEVEIARVVHEEDLVAGGHHVACLLVVSVADLYFPCLSALTSPSYPPFQVPSVLDIPPRASALSPGLLHAPLASQQCH